MISKNTPSQPNWPKERNIQSTSHWIAQIVSKYLSNYFDVWNWNIEMSDRAFVERFERCVRMVAAWLQSFCVSTTTHWLMKVTVFTEGHYFIFSHKDLWIQVIVQVYCPELKEFLSSWTNHQDELFCEQ